MSEFRHAKNNVYDDPVFFENYRLLRQNDTGLNGILEVPALRALLPCLKHKQVLDLGSGFGDFARYARQGGAASVTGIELSEKMFTEAQKLTNDPHIRYLHGSMTCLPAALKNFDIIVSSLAIHYIADFTALANDIYTRLQPGGYFVFSVEHPMCTAFASSYQKDEHGRFVCMPVDNYQDESRRLTHWFVDDVVKYHRTVQHYVTALLDAGFELRALQEPKIPQKWLDVRPETDIFNRYAPFLLLSARRPGARTDN
ncbi:TPA: class I SAM-dependent methyltransferase [Morganella morganii]|nr:class I SAM-dependent methyltransferase [Morganella morganii]HBH7051029.1 class I SAM-dependent methyltransferase [Morganella morganii]HEI9844823.1 class I SAM-dependent methyltransferase [Morganella morganii]